MRVPLSEMRDKYLASVPVLDDAERLLCHLSKLEDCFVTLDAFCCVHVDEEDLNLRAVRINDLFSIARIASGEVEKLISQNPSHLEPAERKLWARINLSVEALAESKNVDQSPQPMLDLLYFSVLCLKNRRKGRDSLSGIDKSLLESECYKRVAKEFPQPIVDSPEDELVQNLTSNLDAELTTLNV